MSRQTRMILAAVGLALALIALAVLVFALLPNPIISGQFPIDAGLLTPPVVTP